jgi:hypothetical protein
MQPKLIVASFLLRSIDELISAHFLPMRLVVTELICVLRTASEKDAIPDDLSIAITNALMGRGPMTDFAKKNAVDIPLACFVSKTYNSA